MQLTTEQFRAAEEGRPVRIDANGKTFILLSQEAYDSMDQVSYEPWTDEERAQVRLSTIASLDDDLTEDDDDES